jgi:hypothetical protein
MYVASGTLYARSTTGSIEVAPEPGRIIRFGRNLPKLDPDVHLAVGPEDRRVSRHHGELTFHRRQWWLRNTGRQLLRLPRGQFIHKATDPIPLSPGPTWLYVKGSGFRDHLVELFVTDDDQWRRRSDAQPPGAETWSTEDYGAIGFDELLALVALGESYLHYAPEPRPRTYREAAILLKDVDPQGRWSEKKVERKATKVREQVHLEDRRKATFPYKVMPEEGEPKPTDNRLLHNLLRGLVEQAILTPPHLGLLDEEPEFRHLDAP